MRTLLSLVAALGLTALAQSQPSLVSLASEAGVDWLLGEWEATTDDGSQIEVAFRPELGAKIIAVHYKDGRSEAKGLILLEPGSQEPKYYTGDSLGGTGSGTWSAEDGKAVLRYRYTSPEMNTQRMGFVFKKTETDRMEIAVHELDSSDVLGSSNWSLVFKRKK